MECSEKMIEVYTIQCDQMKGDHRESSLILPRGFRFCPFCGKQIGFGSVPGEQPIRRARMAIEEMI